MLFKISRTSLWNDEKPCEEAIEKEYDYIEVGTLHSAEEFDEKFAKEEGKWLSKGINHCINEEGYIQRTFPNARKRWFIEINSLEELMNFYKKYGNLIIEEESSNRSIVNLEIYDDWRE